MVARCHGAPLSRTVQKEEEEGWESEGEEVVRESLWDGSGVMDHKSLDPSLEQLLLDDAFKVAGYLCQGG